MASTPMMSEAPLSRAPAVAQSPMGLGEATVSPSARRHLQPMPVERDVGQQHALLIREVVGDLREPFLRVGNACTPSADCRAGRPPILSSGSCRGTRPDVVLAEEAAPQRRYRADQHAVTSSSTTAEPSWWITPTGSWPASGSTGHSPRRMCTSSRRSSSWSRARSCRWAQAFFKLIAIRSLEDSRRASCSVPVRTAVDGDGDDGHRKPRSSLVLVEPTRACSALHGIRPRGPAYGIERIPEAPRPLAARGEPKRQWAAEAGEGRKGSCALW